MATLFSDNFNRANGAMGSNWVFDGGGGNSVSINTNRARLFCNDGSLICVVRTATAAHASVADCKVSCTRITGSGFDGGPVVRKAASTAFTFYYLDFWGTNTVNLYRAVQGSSDALLATYTVTHAANDVYALEVSGTNPVVLKSYRNGTLLGTQNDTAASRITAAGQTGLHAWARNIDFDDFLVEDLAAGGTVEDRDGTASAAFAASGVGSAVLARGPSASFAATAAGVGAALADSVGTASAGAAAAAVGASLADAAGSAAAAVTATAVGASYADAVGSASMSATASAASDTSATGTASAGFSAAGVGQAVVDMVGTASLSATAAGAGSAVVDTVGSTTGAFEAPGQSAPLADGAGAALVTASADGVSSSVADVVGLASAQLAADAVASAVADRAPAAAMSATALAIALVHVTDPPPTRIARAPAQGRTHTVAASGRTARAPGNSRRARA